MLTDKSKISEQLTAQNGVTDQSDAANQTQQKLKPEQVPFKDLESLFSK